MAPRVPLRFVAGLVIAALTALFATKSARAAPIEEGEPQLLSLYTYKPIYFLIGGEYTKIEFSFKTQIVRAVPVYFGYSQLMLWDLFNSSPFFYDINYNPLAWYRLSLDEKSQQWLDLIPWEHESNGKGGAEERGWDRSAIAYHRKQDLTAATSLFWELKAWVPFRYNPNNPDLAQYRGVWELSLTLSDFLGPMFEFSDVILRLYPGGQSLTNPLHGGQELTVRLKNVHRAFLPLFVFQLFQGYGEYLQDYQQREFGLRMGLGF